MASGAPLPPLTPVLFCLSQVIPAMLASRSLTSPCLRLLFLLPWSALPRALPLEGSAGEVCTLVLLSGILIPSYSCPTPSPGFRLPLALPTCLYPLLPDHPGLGACHLLRPTPLWPPWVRSCDALTLTVISGCPCSGWALRAPVLSAGPPPLLMLAARLPLALCLPCISRQVWGQTRLPHSGLLFPLPVTSHTDLFLRTSARDIREPALSPCCSRGFPTLLLYLALFPAE